MSPRMCHAGAYAGRYVIVIDDDIDVSNLEELIWAMLTRSDPATSIDIIHNAWSTPLDPRIEPERKAKGDFTNSRAIIDACRPLTVCSIFSAAAKKRVASSGCPWRQAIAASSRRAHEKRPAMNTDSATFSVLVGCGLERITGRVGKAVQVQAVVPVRASPISGSP